MRFQKAAMRFQNEEAIISTCVLTALGSRSALSGVNEHRLAPGHHGQVKGPVNASMSVEWYWNGIAHEVPTMPNLPRALFAVTTIIIALGAAVLDRSARAADGEAAVDAKIDPIIECLNHSDAHIQRGIHDYRKLLAQIEKDPNTGHIAFL